MKMQNQTLNKLKGWNLYNLNNSSHKIIIKIILNRKNHKKS